MAEILDGKQLAASLREPLAQRAAALTARGCRPGLAVIRVGDDPASEIYVRNKARMCQRLGLFSIELHLPAETSEERLFEEIDRLNQDERIHGILVQLPLPPHLDESAVAERIAPHKDVDGFGSRNLGMLLKGQPGILPCTPKGILRLLQHAGVPLLGKRAVVVGRSLIVGKPTALLLMRENATVTLCHSRTENLREHTLQADLLVSAVGRPELIDGSYIKEGAVVIDVGINRTERGLLGDVHFESATQKASLITPVPGGVGPMTIIMLMENTIEAAELAAFK